jgi:hypothetical protein
MPKNQTLLTLCQRVAKRVFLPEPDTAYSSTNEDIMQLVELTRELGEDLVEKFDWNILRTQKTFNGTDVTDTGEVSTLALESDHCRFAGEPMLWDTSLDVPCWGPLSVEAWDSVRVRESNSSRPYWTLQGDQINLYPEVTLATETFRYTYISCNWIYDVSDNNTLVADFTGDGDKFIFDDALMRYGLIYKWKEEKGMAYEEAMIDYERRLELVLARDRASPGVSITPEFEDVPADWWPGVIDA